MGFFDKIVTGIKTATVITPLVIDLVKVFELPEASKQGVNKKDAVIGIIKAALDVIPEEAKQAIGGDNTIKLVSSVIDVVVRFLNLIGVFRK